MNPDHPKFTIFLIAAITLISNSHTKGPYSIHEAKIPLDFHTSSFNKHILSGSFGFTFNMQRENIPSYNFAVDISQREIVAFLGETHENGLKQRKHRIPVCTKESSFCVLEKKEPLKSQSEENIQVKFEENVHPKTSLEIEGICFRVECKFKYGTTIAPFDNSDYQPGSEIDLNSDLGVKFVNWDTQLPTNGLGLGINSDYIRWVGANYNFRNSPNPGDVMFHIRINRGDKVKPEFMPFAPITTLGEMVFKWYKSDDDAFHSSNQFEIEMTNDKWSFPDTSFTLSKSSSEILKISNKNACLMTTSNSLIVFGTLLELETFTKAVSQLMCNKDSCTGDDIDIDNGPNLTLVLLDDSEQSEDTLEARTITFKPKEYLI